MIQVDVHDFNTHLVQKKKKSSVSRYFAIVGHTSVVGVSSSRISKCPASVMHGLDQVVDHLRWDGHPPLLEGQNNSRTSAGAFPLPGTRLSNSFQVCLFGFQSGDMEGQGRILDVVVVGEELCGVACCMGSGIVVLKNSATQCLMPEIKQQKNRRFYF